MEVRSKNCIDYYPFGGTFNSYTKPGTIDQNYLFNAGSEFQNELGIYQTAQRMYDPMLGRFWGVDVLADLFPSMSPMLYSYNNPLMFNDPLGLAGVPGCDECGDAVVLGEVTVTASRLPQIDYSSLLSSFNPINRSVGRAYQNRDHNLMHNYTTNQRLHYSHGQYLTEKLRPNKTSDAWMKMAAYGIGGTMLVAYGSPMLANMIGEGSISLSAASIKTTLFGTANLGSKAYLTKAGFGMAVETTNQLLTVGPSQLDFIDIGSQGFLGLNTPQSAAVGAVFDYKPFANDYSFVNLNSGAAVDFATSYTAGKIGGLKLILGSGAQPLIQWGSDLSMKVISEGTKKAIEQ